MIFWYYSTLSCHPPVFFIWGVTASEDLLRQLAAERVKGLPVLHFDGSIYELLDLADGVAGDGEEWEMVGFFENRWVVNLHHVLGFFVGVLG